MNSLHKAKRGTILVAALIGLVVGGMIVGSLLKLVSQDTMATEKEIGHAKAAQVLKLASTLQNTVVGNSTLSQSQQDALILRIGGGGSLKPIFGLSSGSTPSTIPGFDQFSVVWDQTVTATTWTLQQPTNPNGFWYFPGSMTSTITSTHSGASVPALRNGTKAVLSSTNPTQTVPAFSMLSFYQNNWEIAAHYESAQLIGRINSNGSIYLDCRDSGPDRIRFHALQNFPSLSTPNAVYRRGANGATSYYKFGSNANAGLDFYVYSQANFSTLINSTDLNYTDNTTRITFPTGGGTSRDLTPGFTNYETSPENTDTGSEPVARRFGGNGANYGYVFTGTNSLTGATFDANAVAPATTATVAAIQFGTQVPILQPPVTINPYQYVEDHQYADTPDVIQEQYPSTTPSNYAEDAALTGSLAGLSFNSLAALVIRDGVAYYRTTPGGNLAPVMNLLGDNAFYPDISFVGSKKYGDLRWYGHFGQNSGVAASESNPDRWHFPIRSVTFNKTKDLSNAGDASTDTEGSAVPFTFNSSTIMNPVTDGVSSGTASWIDRTKDLNQLQSPTLSPNTYPDLATTVASTAATGAGVGMWNVSYPTIGNSSVELYDPVRVAYNIVKDNVRKLHNAVHIYTSRHNGSRMLNSDGSTPATTLTAPNVWGTGVMPNVAAASPFTFGFDKNADGDIDDAGESGVDYTGDGVTDYSAFWNDDGAFFGSTAAKRLYIYRRDSNGNTDARQGELYDSGVADTTPPVELFPIRDLSLIDTTTTTTRSKMNNWFIYKSTLPLSDRTLPMPGNRDYLEGLNAGTAYITNSDTTQFPTAVVAVGGNNTGRNSPRCRNFGWAGATATANLTDGVYDFSGATPAITASGWTNPSGGVPNGAQYHNWYTLLNNAPEMLARQNNSVTTYSAPGGTTNPGITFEVDFGYFAQREAGGYYGIDNLCTIDAQEKKILVFTEIDMAELTSECFSFNGLTSAWGFDFYTNTANTTTPTALQNIIYVVNTTMGKNFFGKRVHCGAVRLKRGALIDYPISIATPNALHVWGDFNSPGYWHHGKGGGTANVNYTVPATHQYPATAVTRQPVGFYADTIACYENSFIPFAQNSTSADSIRDNSYGALTNTLPTGGDVEEQIYVDQKLWWEDDGMRRLGVSSGSIPAITTAGFQLFTNYHETIFNHANNDYYTANSAWGRNESSQIWKHIPQSVSAGFMYGNVPSFLPSYFYQADVDAIAPVNAALTAVSRPASIDQLDWLMSWILRSPKVDGTPRWVELTRDQMRSDLSNTVNNGGFTIPAGQGYYSAGTVLTPANYFGTNFPGSGNSEWEDCKLKFSGGGFIYDIRTFDNHTHNLDEWTSNRQTFGRNLLGSFTCLFPARQSTHGFNQTMLGIENQQVFCAYDQSFNTATSLPPGTPMTTIVPTVNYQLEGSRWQYQ